MHTAIHHIHNPAICCEGSLSCFVQTWYISQLLYFPMGMVDICVYISTSYKFYLHLKGRRDEAKSHSTSIDHFQKVHIVNRFFFIQVGTLGIFLMLLLTGLLSFILVPINIVNYNPYFLSYITLGLIPNFVITKQIEEVTPLIQLYCYYFELISCFIAELLLIACYLSLSIKIITVPFRSCRKHTHNNKELTRVTRDLLE